MSTTITVAEPSESLLLQTKEAHDVARSYTIDCAEMREAASDDLKKVKALAKQVDAERKAITGPLDVARARVMDLYRRPMQFLADAETILKSAMLKWDQEQERKRQLAAAEAARRADEERKRLEAEAKAQEAAGNTETAHAIAQASLFVAPAPVAEPPKMAGESTREVWSAELVDIIALAQAVAEHRVSPEYLLPNMPALNAVARALKGSMAVPGVKSVATKVLASREAA